MAEGTKSLVPTDVEGDSGLETGRFDDVSWRSLSPFVSPILLLLLFTQGLCRLPLFPFCCTIFSRYVLLHAVSNLRLGPGPLLIISERIRSLIADRRLFISAAAVEYRLYSPSSHSTTSRGRRKNALAQFISSPSSSYNRDCFIRQMYGGSKAGPKCAFVVSDCEREG